MIITRFSHLIQAYQRLGGGDLFVGQIPASHLKPAMLVDLTMRGVRLLPSATAQLLNGSKTVQAFVLHPYMMPYTQVVARRKDLLDAVSRYAKEGIQTVVTKEDRMHCGHGVRKWESLETLYSCLSLDRSNYPFVLQPFVAELTDLRVIIVGDYCEAYVRHNAHNFRMNLAAGGQRRPHQLSAEQYAFCRQVMQRGQMPYAHIDLMMTAPSNLYLSEISLNGGICGAQTNRKRLDQMKRARLAALAQEVVGSVEKTDRAAVD